ncbi:hypothetical protein Ah1_00073 [Aeromonas phage Ah1]|uniref:Uncharacterized protein n=1 Tax=Aeromonas phage Ah1 TaxID=2053701 RepID=A0A2H4YF60_9CAUD|nr:hypothetical protein KNT77_gp073 [Aeromonas phage Ah1]AUE22614.1 hypothetical protein Ah1_00073 [Aeromonas phage Ah1]
MTVQMKKEKAYEITISTDERRSAVFCYSTSESLGLELSKGKGWYGGNGACYSGAKDVLTFDIDGEEFSFLVKDRITVIRKREDYEIKINNEKKAAALAKLSDEEKKILGLI